MKNTIKVFSGIFEILTKLHGDIQKAIGESCSNWPLVAAKFPRVEAALNNCLCTRLRNQCSPSINFSNLMLLNANCLRIIRNH